MRTISNKVPVKESAKKRVPQAGKDLHVSRPVDTDVQPGMCMVAPLICVITI